MNARQHKIDMLEAIATDLENNLGNGSAYVYEQADGVLYDEKQIKLRERVLEDVIRSLRRRAELMRKKGTK